MSGHRLATYRTETEDNGRWEDVELRPGDIVISTPAKCGTTWLQMICALLVFQTPELPAPLDTLSLFIDQQVRSRPALVAALATQRHRRFLKTHTPLDGLPFDDRVTYLTVGRDPRDVAVSTANHDRNMDRDAVRALRDAVVGQPGRARPAPPPATGQPATSDRDVGPAPSAGGLLPDRDRFWSWMESPAATYGLAGMLHHLAGFWELRDRRNVMMLHYDDLLADLDGQMRMLAGRLDIPVAEQRWPELVAAATFTQMRARSGALVPGAIWRDPARFFHRGTSGQWRELLDDQDRQRYAALVDRLADPDLSAWLHRTPLR